MVQHLVQKKRSGAFNCPAISKSQLGLQEKKLDKLCGLVEKVMERNSPLEKKLNTKEGDASDNNMSGNEKEENGPWKRIWLKIKKNF